jgi:hypothetical protein
MTTLTTEKITLSAAAAIVVREMRETYVELRGGGLSDEAIAATCKFAVQRLSKEAQSVATAG